MNVCKKRIKCEHIAFKGMFNGIDRQDYVAAYAIGGGMFSCCDCGLTLTQILYMQERKIERMTETLTTITKICYPPNYIADCMRENALRALEAIKS